MSDIKKRFDEKWDEDGCWLWTAARNQNGYGRFWDGVRLVQAHRWSYEYHVGAIPEGLQLDHLCRVRHCVNPEHLEPVTHAENGRRGLAGAWQAAKTHCKNGHEFTDANTLWRGPDKRHRGCRTCLQASGRKWYHTTRLNS